MNEQELLSIQNEMAEINFKLDFIDNTYQTTNNKLTLKNCKEAIISLEKRYQGLQNRLLKETLKINDIDIVKTL